MTLKFPHVDQFSHKSPSYDPTRNRVFFSLQSFSWLSLVPKDNVDLEWMVLTVIGPEWPLTPVEAQFDDPP